MTDKQHPQHVSLIGVPEAMVSTITGLFDVLNSMAVLGSHQPNLPDQGPFVAEIVTEAGSAVITASGLSLPGRAMTDIERTDIVIVPSLMPAESEWITGRHPDMVAWLQRMHADGAILSSACTGVLLLAETGLFDGRDVTIHPQLLDTFRKNFPQVALRPEHVLVTSGEREEFVTSGANTTWHDLVLYFIARFAGPTAAIEMARFFALQCHHKGQALYAVFAPPYNHGDAMVREAQEKFQVDFASEHPVDEVVCHSGYAARTFQRRFRTATGYTPMGYVQRLRVEAAKRRLERTDAPVDVISADVGYHDPAFFRRLFKRLTNVSPGVYRQQLQIPQPVRQSV